MIKTNDIHISGFTPIITPEKLKEQFSADNSVLKLVNESRQIISNIIRKKDKRLLVVTGPCSIHDPKAALEYAERLKELAKKVGSTMYLTMRVYFEKPRTTLGWRGLIIDPDLDGSYKIEAGLKQARKILINILKTGLSASSEMLDPIIPQYIADLISWSAIGARTTESQIHRELASGLSMPVGFKNGMDGSLEAAINAQISSSSSHSFIGIDQTGQTSIVTTEGNKDAHIILRGGKNGPNYYDECVEEAEEEMKANKLEPALVIDCSHGNSGKKHLRQERVFNAVIRQKLEERESIVGLMLESNLFEGNQKINSDLDKLMYGVSITDECISWENTEKLLLDAHEKLGG